MYEVTWSGGDGADYMQVDIHGDIVTVEVEPPFDFCITAEDEYVSYNALCTELLKALDEYGVSEEQLIWPYPDGVEVVPCHQVCYEVIEDGEGDEENEEKLCIVKVKPTQGLELKAQKTVYWKNDYPWQELERELEQQAVRANIPRSSFAFDSDWRYCDAIDDYGDD